MIADSERDANMLYATGLFVPDPFIYLRAGGRPLLVMSDLEIDRARAQAPHCRVAVVEPYQQKLLPAASRSPGLAHVVRLILRETSDPPRHRAGRFSPRPGDGLEKTRGQRPGAARKFFPATRDQVRSRSPQNIRGLDDGGSGHGRRHAGAPRRQNRPPPQTALP